MQLECLELQRAAHVRRMLTAVGYLREELRYMRSEHVAIDVPFLSGRLRAYVRVVLASALPGRHRELRRPPYLRRVLTPHRLAFRIARLGEVHHRAVSGRREARRPLARRTRTLGKSRVAPRAPVSRGRFESGPRRDWRQKRGDCPATSDAPVPP
jgi:hypothetical protein